MLQGSDHRSEVAHLKPARDAMSMSHARRNAGVRLQAVFMLPNKKTIAYAQYCTSARPICSSCARHTLARSPSVSETLRLKPPRCRTVAATRVSMVLSIIAMQKGSPSAANCQGLRMRSTGLHDASGAVDQRPAASRLGCGVGNAIAQLAYGAAKGATHRSKRMT